MTTPLTISNNYKFSTEGIAPLHIVLAEDDYDDCYLFKYALEEIKLPCTLATVKNGEVLMDLLNDETRQMPDILFLDINMPRKNGFECLEEIKNNERLKHLPVIIFSTSFSPPIIDQLYKDGARYYIRKPDDVKEFKNVIYQAITLATQKDNTQPSAENFVL